MNRYSIGLLLWLLVVVESAASTRNEPNVLGPFTDIQSDARNFYRCLPLDWNSVEKRWRYIVRYQYYDLRSGEQGSLFLVRKNEAMVLASIDYNKVSFEAFDLMNGEQKLAAAAFSTEIDIELAQEIYAAWVYVLLGSQPAGASGSTGGSEIYLSAYGVDAGYMCARAHDAIPDATTGRIVEIGRLLSRYVEERATMHSSALREMILKQAKDVRLRLP